MPKYKIGDLVKSKVTGIESYGIFVSLDDNYTGLIHISEISDKFVRSVFDYVQLGEEIVSKVIDVIEDEKKVKLSIKNLDYRVEDKKELEDKNGFTQLREKLPGWISEYNSKNEE